MEKIIAEELYKTDPEKFEIFRKWGSVNEKIHNFEIKANLKTFQLFFDEEEGERLYKHIKINCGDSLIMLRKYLLPEQFNDLLVNIYYNEYLFII